MKKRVIAALCALALLLGVLPVSAAGAAGSAGPFRDISDPQVAEAAELLRLLGIMEGTAGGAFHPEGILTRAEFCKLAVEMMGRGGEEPGQRGRTIFQDVGPGHWARGYVNLASSITLGNAASGGEGDAPPAGQRLIMGVGNGCFAPDRPITWGEAVAMLTRILDCPGGTAGGLHWYDGYLAAADAIGLTDGLELGGDSPITRGQAALLLNNMLFTPAKGGGAEGDSYLVRALGCSVQEPAIVLSIEPGEADGSRIVTSGGSFRSRRTALDGDLIGVRGAPVLDRNGRLLTVLPQEGDTIRRAVVQGQPQANRIPLSDGSVLPVTLDTPVWRSGEADPTVYEKVWTNLYNGAPLVICTGRNGTLAYLYLASASAASEDIMVARSKPSGTANPFGLLTRGEYGYQIYKNGAPASLADLRQYDVAVYDRAAKILQVSDRKLTGRYENASPNPAAPVRITILGAELKVLPGAVSDLAAFKPGDSVTLLLTGRGEVAGAVDPSAARADVVGIASEVGTSAAKVEPLTPLYGADGTPVVFTGNPRLSESAAGKLRGQLVRVSSARPGQITLSKLSGSGARGGLDVAARRLDGAPLAENAALFERVGSSAPARIHFDQITRPTIPASKILYVGKDSTGSVNLLVFDDVTGDQYTYGFARFVDRNPEEGRENASISVHNGGEGLGPLTCGTAFRYNEPLGIAASVETLDGNPRLAGSVRLAKAPRVGRAAFDLEAGTVLVEGEVFPISKEVISFNRSTGFWFEAGLNGVEAARAYSEVLTVYYDKPPQSGGKIRMVVVE